MWELVWIFVRVCQVTQLRLLHLFYVLCGKRLFVGSVLSVKWTTLHHGTMLFFFLIHHPLTSWSLLYLTLPLNKANICTADLYFSVGWSAVYLRSEQQGWMMCWNSRDMDFKNISKLLSQWLIICCIYSQDSKSQQTRLTLALFFSSSIFFKGSFPTFLFVFFPFCWIMNVHHDCFILGNCHRHYLFNPSLCVCQILISIAALQNINCLLFINRLARCSQAEIQLCLRSVRVKCGAGYRRTWIIHACFGSVHVF